MKTTILRGAAVLLTGCILTGSINNIHGGVYKTAYAEELQEENIMEDEITDADNNSATEENQNSSETDTDVSDDFNAEQDDIENEPEEITKTAKKTLRVNQKWLIDKWSLGSVKWKSSNKKVATVNSSGVVTAKKVGKTELSTKVENTTYICKLTVKKSNFKPVPLRKLANYSSLKKRMTDKQFKKAYKKALKIVRPLGDLSKEEKLMGVAVALRQMVEEGMEYSMSTPHYNDPYGYFVLKTASCAGCVRATGLCLNILGIKYEHINENQYSHQWARVKVGKKYWICDAYGLYCGPEPGKRKHPYF